MHDRGLFCVQKKCYVPRKKLSFTDTISPPYPYYFVLEFKIIDFTDSWQLNRVSLSDNESCIKDTRAPVHRNWYIPCTDLEALVNDQRPFKAGQLQYCIAEWGTLTLNPEVLDYLQHCHVEFISEPSQFSGRGRKNFNLQQQAVICSEIDNLLHLGVVSPSTHEIGECLSPIFLLFPRATVPYA